MDNYTQSLIDRYHERQLARKDFELHTRRIFELFDFPPGKRLFNLHTLLTPLIAIAWSDGRIGVHEKDAIMRAGEVYGLLADGAAGQRLVESLTSRPTADEVDAGWEAISRTSYSLQPDEIAAVASLLYQQAKFIGELGQKHEFGRLNELRLGRDEEELLHTTEDRLAEILCEVTDNREHPEIAELRKADERLMKVIPLVKVAWADGRVSKRERQMIFASIAHFGIDQTPENIAKLAEWLDLQPDDEFFQQSLEELGFELADRGNDSLQSTKYEIISRCTLVADASGTFSRDEGTRICDEEIHTVKEIAKILTGGFSGSAKSASRR